MISYPQLAAVLFDISLLGLILSAVYDITNMGYTDTTYWLYGLGACAFFFLLWVALLK